MTSFVLSIPRTVALVFAGFLFCIPPSLADNGFPYPDTRVLPSHKTFTQVWKDLETAISDHKMGLVSQASASIGASRRGIKIPGNAVFGVYRNDFAVRMLAASVPAGIEAPLRIYLTEDKDGHGRLSYRRPSAVFKPYRSAKLDTMARELDKIFAAIADQAVK